MAWFLLAETKTTPMGSANKEFNAKSWGFEGAGCQRYRPKRQGVPRGPIALAGLTSGWFD